MSTTLSLPPLAVTITNTTVANITTANNNDCDYYYLKKMYNINVNFSASNIAGVRWKILFNALIKSTTSVCSHILCDIIAVRVPGQQRWVCSVTF